MLQDVKTRTRLIPYALALAALALTTTTRADGVQGLLQAQTRTVSSAGAAAPTQAGVRFAGAPAAPQTPAATQQPARSAPIPTTIARARMPLDWTHNALVFSNPGPAPDPSNRAAYERWSKITHDIRFQIHSAQMNAKAAAARSSAFGKLPALPSLDVLRGNWRPRREPLPQQIPIERDWSMLIIPGATGTAPSGVQRYAAKYSFDTGTTPFCDSDPNPDFVVFATGSATVGAPDVVAFDNLYKAPTCSGSVPMYFFQYSIDGTVPSSPVFSYDGTQLAFINVNGTVASLVLLKWAKDPALVTMGTATPAASYRTCVAPCFTRITLNGSPNSSGSSVFYDYNTDSIYVGDNSGVVHKFTNAFLSGTPAEITGGGLLSGWPQTLHTGAMPSGVLEPVSDNFIIGTGTQLARIPAAGGSLNIVKATALRTACGITTPPMIDIVAGRVYVTLGDLRIGTGTIGTCGSSAQGGPGVAEYSTTFAGGSAPIAQLQLPNGTARNTANISTVFGQFDYSYYASATPTSPTGYYYACMHAPNPKLVQFSIVNNVLTSFINGPAVATTTTGSPQPTCVPPVEFFDGTSDRLFLGIYTGSVISTGSTFSCGTDVASIGQGCLVSYDITQPFTFSAATASMASLPISGGGASGIIIDNRASGGGSQIYTQSIMPQGCVGNGTNGDGTGWCAIQASQDGLN